MNLTDILLDKSQLNYFASLLNKYAGSLKEIESKKKIYFIGEGITVSVNKITGIASFYENHEIGKSVTTYDLKNKRLIEQAEGEQGKPQIIDEYDELRDEIEAFLDSSPYTSLMIVAGRPGTGKTTMIKAISTASGGIKPLPGLGIGYNKTDAKEIEDRYQKYGDEFSRLENDKDRKDFTARLIMQTQEGQYYKELLYKKNTVEDPEEKREIIAELNGLYIKYMPVSLSSKLRMIGKIDFPYNKNNVFLGSQNVNNSQFYFELMKTNGGVIVYDDSNISFWTDEKLQDLILLATQTEETREISLPGAEEGFFRTRRGSVVPQTFTYTGKIIILTNKNIKALPANIVSRAIPINFNPTSATVLRKTGENLDYYRTRYQKYYPKEWVDEVYQWLQNNVGKGHRIKYDFRLMDKLMFYKHASRKDPEAFDKRAKKIVKDFYALEKGSDTQAAKQKLVRDLLKNYQKIRGFKFGTKGFPSKHRYEKARDYLIMLPPESLESSESMMKRLDSITGFMPQNSQQ